MSSDERTTSLGRDELEESLAEEARLAQPLRSGHSGHAIGDSETWEPPLPLSHARRHDFPIDAFPAWLADYFTAVALHTQTPPDLAGMLGLAVLAAALAGSAVVEPVQGWTEPLNLYTVVALPPGERKTAVFKPLTRPLFELETSLIEESQDEIGDLAMRKRVEEGAAQAAEKRAGSSTKAEDRDSLLSDAREAAKRGGAINVPTAPQLLADDATPEALTSLLADHGRMFVLSAEGGLFDMAAGRYQKTANLTVYLKGHAGDPLRVDRKGRPSEQVVSPALTLGLTVQPSVLRKAAAEPAFRGRGLLERFLYAVPPSRVGSRAVDETPVPVRTEAAYNRRMIRLGRSAYQRQGGQPLVLTLASDARGPFARFREEIEKELGPTGELESVAAWGSKLAGAVARIAGLLHLAAQDEESDERSAQISCKTILAAISLGRYLADQALIAFDQMHMREDIEDARYLLDRIIVKGLNEFSERDAQRIARGKLRHMRRLRPALDVLAEHGWVRLSEPQERSGKTGRPPGQRWQLNPVASCGQNGRNPASREPSDILLAEPIPVPLRVTAPKDKSFGGLQ